MPVRSWVNCSREERAADRFHEGFTPERGRALRRAATCPASMPRRAALPALAVLGNKFDAVPQDEGFCIREVAHNLGKRGAPAPQHKTFAPKPEKNLAKPGPLAHAGPGNPEPSIP